MGKAWEIKLTMGKTWETIGKPLTIGKRMCFNTFQPRTTWRCLMFFDVLKHISMG